MKWWRFRTKGEAALSWPSWSLPTGNLLRRLFYRLSPETLYRRFTSPIARPDQVRPDRLLDVDHRDREAIVAVDDGEIVGVARYFRQPGSDAAELAIVVADAWQGQGLATRMLAALAGQASAAGIERFTLITQADNSPALRLLRRVDPSVRLALSYGVLRDDGSRSRLKDRHRAVGERSR